MDISSEIIVCDIEATCCEDNSFPREEMEIIEIGLVMFDLKCNRIVDRYESLVIPVINPILNKFCTDLTGISQEELESKGKSYKEVMEEVSNWIGDTSNFVWGSWGYFDRNILEIECKRKSTSNPFGEMTHYNLSDEFRKKINSKRKLGLTRALNRLEISYEGQKHRALSDAVNTCKLLPYIFD